MPDSRVDFDEPLRVLGRHIEGQEAAWSMSLQNIQSHVTAVREAITQRLEGMCEHHRTDMAQSYSLFLDSQADALKLFTTAQAQHRQRYIELQERSKMHLDAMRTGSSDELASFLDRLDEMVSSLAVPQASDTRRSLDVNRAQMATVSSDLQNMQVLPPTEANSCPISRAAADQIQVEPPLIAADTATTWTSPPAYTLHELSATSTRDTEDSFDLLIPRIAAQFAAQFGSGLSGARTTQEERN